MITLVRVIGGHEVVMDWIKKAPTTVVITVIIVCGVIALGVLAAFVTLTLAGADTSEFRQWINTIGQILVYPLLGVTTVASVQAARSASRTEDQTNGIHDAKDAQITALTKQLYAARTARGDSDR